MMMEWDKNRHALCAGEMDEAHQLSVQLIRELALATEENELARLEQLRDHCEEHFRQEQAWMEAAAMPFPEKHVRDHVSIQTVLLKARDALRAGQVGAGRQISSELFAWFDHHFVTYDAALAVCMLQTRKPPSLGIPAVG